MTLATWQLEVALQELANGAQFTFSEKLQRERYLPHLATFKAVKSSKDGDRKHARLLSDIHKGVM
jgi:hypothetical protein